jgi:flagella basal body P-ring formation protein FlgA
MFKLFIIFFIFVTSVFAEKLILKSNYDISNRTVYSTDLFENLDKKFEITKIPSHSFEKKVPVSKIKSIFKQNGIILNDVPNAFYVSFKSKMNFDSDRIKNKLYNEFTEYYDQLEIEAITIEPTTKTNLDSFTIENINISKFALNKSKGTLSVHFRNSENTTKNIYFKFEIIGKQKLLLSSRNIEKGEILSKDNISYTFVPFTKKQVSTTMNILNNKYLCASRNIRKGSLITDNLVEKLDVIKKGSNVTVVYSKGVIDIEFNGTALQSGSFDDIIIVERGDKKYKARIIDTGLVAIE